MARLKVANCGNVQTNKNNVRFSSEKKTNDNQQKKKSTGEQSDTNVSCSGKVNESKRCLHKHRPGTKALQEIRRYQRGTGFLVPRTAFRQVIKQISNELTKTTKMRFTAEAVEALQVASEAMIIQVFEDSVLIMVHSKRVTLMEKDVKLVRRIRGV